MRPMEEHQDVIEPNPILENAILFVLRQGPKRASELYRALNDDYKSYNYNIIEIVEVLRILLRKRAIVAIFPYFYISHGDA